MRKVSSETQEPSTIVVSPNASCHPASWKSLGVHCISVQPLLHHFITLAHRFFTFSGMPKTQWLVHS